MTITEHLDRIALAMGSLRCLCRPPALMMPAEPCPTCKGLQSVTAIREQIAEMERQREADASVLVDLAGWRDKEIAALTAKRDALKARCGRYVDRIVAIVARVDQTNERIATLEQVLRQIAEATSEPGIAARVRAVLPVEVRAEMRAESERLAEKGGGK